MIYHHVLTHLCCTWSGYLTTVSREEDNVQSLLMVTLCLPVLMLLCLLMVVFASLQCLCFSSRFLDLLVAIFMSHLNSFSCCNALTELLIMRNMKSPHTKAPADPSGLLCPSAQVCSVICTWVNVLIDYIDTAGRYFHKIIEFMELTAWKVCWIVFFRKWS